MGSKVIEIYNKIAYNVLSALYQPFWLPFSLHFLQCSYIFMRKNMNGRRTILLEIYLQHGGEHLEVLQIFVGHSY